MSEEKSSLKLLLGKYKDPDLTKYTVSQLQHAGIRVFDVYSPFPIHGMENTLGLKRSRLTVAAFMYGILGLFTALLMQIYMMVIDWPMDIGGKPAFMGPALVPIGFEITVLFTAFGTVFTFLLVNKMFPWKNPNILDPKVTDDVFVVAVDADKNFGNEEKVNEIFRQTGAFEVTSTEIEDEYFDVYIP